MANGQTRVAWWQPLDLIERVAREPFAVFSNGTGAAPFLIVRLDDFSNNLADALAAADAVVKRKNVSRVLSATLQLSSPFAVAMTQPPSAERPTQPRLPGADAGAPDSAPGAAFPAPELLDAKCYVVRLSNRISRPGPLSIGRDASHSIVLNHPSVSATHAQLSLEPACELRDASSRNGTFVNGVQCTGTLPVQPGDRLKFGAVQTVLCSAVDFWRLLR